MAKRTPKQPAMASERGCGFVAVAQRSLRRDDAALGETVCTPIGLPPGSEFADLIRPEMKEASRGRPVWVSTPER
jgi:hypothetical protein